MLVTALICNYNYGCYLSNAIESALNQTWPNMEIIVVDDGSTDNSREVLERYRDRVNIIFKENGGQASAFNSGIAIAKGNIICFLDSDDVWHPRMVSTVVEKYKKANFALVCSNYAFIDALDNEIDKPPHAGNVELKSGDVYRFQQENGYPWVFSPTSGMSIPSRVARRLMPIPEEDFRISADIALAYGSICHGPVGTICEVLFNYRIHGRNGFAYLYGVQENTRRKLVNLVDSVRRYLYMKSVALSMGKLLSSDPSQFYSFFRALVYTAKPNPPRYLTKLLVLNLRTHLGKRRCSLESIAQCIRYGCNDSLLALLFMLRLRTPYDEIRAMFSRGDVRIPDEVRDYMTS